MEIFFKGIAAGFIIAVPLGPVSVLCFRRVLTERPLVGLFTVFGAALADTLYGLIGATGLTAVTHTLLTHREPLRLLGGIFLLWLGVRMMRAQADDADKVPAAGQLPAAFGSAFLLMLANPTIIISFLAVFAAIDLSAAHAGLAEASWLGAGVFLGSTAWWLVYKGASLWFGARLKENGLHLINLGAGLLICGFGVWQLVEMLLHL